MLADATHQLNDTRGALIGRFSAAIAAIDAHHQEHGGDSMAFMAGQVGQLQADITALRDRYGIPDVVPALIPAWVTDPNFKTSPTENRGPQRRTHPAPGPGGRRHGGRRPRPQGNDLR